MVVNKNHHQSYEGYRQTIINPTEVKRVDPVLLRQEHSRVTYNVFVSSDVSLESLKLQHYSFLRLYFTKSNKSIGFRDIKPEGPA